MNNMYSSARRPDISTNSAVDPPSHLSLPPFPAHYTVAEDAAAIALLDDAERQAELDAELQAELDLELQAELNTELQKELDDEEWAHFEEETLAEIEADRKREARKVSLRHLRHLQSEAEPLAIADFARHQLFKSYTSTTELRAELDQLSPLAISQIIHLAQSAEKFNQQQIIDAFDGEDLRQLKREKSYGF